MSTPQVSTTKGTLLVCRYFVSFLATLSLLAASLTSSSALDKCLAYDDIQAALGVKHRLMVAGIAIALGGAYEDAVEAARDNHSSTPSTPSSTFASAPPYQAPTSSLRNRDLFKWAYDAYEIAFVVLAEGE